MAKSDTDETKTVDPTIYLDKGPTTLQARFATWIQEEVGYNPNAAKTKLAAFEEGVRIATATRMVFQASDYNRAETAKERAAREAAAEAAAAAAEEVPAKPAKASKASKAAPAKAAPAKAAPKKAAPAATEETDEQDTTPAPVKPARRPARRAAGTKPAAEAPF